MPELASEQHPNAAIVYSRWGDYYAKLKDNTRVQESWKRQ